MKARSQPVLSRGSRSHTRATLSADSAKARRLRRSGSRRSSVPEDEEPGNGSSPRVSFWPMAGLPYNAVNEAGADHQPYGLANLATGRRGTAPLPDAPLRPTH